MSKIQGFILYRIWSGDVLVYLGRTKQPLPSRIHGHLFKKPMQRSISINLVTKIEYAEFQTEAEITSMIVDGGALDITIFAFEKCGADWYKQDEGFGKN